MLQGGWRKSLGSPRAGEEPYVGIGESRVGKGLGALVKAVNVKVVPLNDGLPEIFPKSLGGGVDGGGCQNEEVVQPWYRISESMCLLKPRVPLEAGGLGGFWQEDMMRIAVLGAGISGLVCARALAQGGHHVTVWEKSRSLGGRCATRKFGDHVVDHGVQYFTLRDPGVREEVQRLCGSRLKTLPNPILVAGQDGEIHRNGEERFYLADGNNRLGALLAEGVLVKKETEIKKLEKAGKKWRIQGEEYDRVVCSTPWPQTAALLGKKVSVPSYDPCLTVLLEYLVPREEATAGSAYARIDPSGRDPLAWTACENVKVGRIAAGSTVYVIQASPDYSREHLEQSPEYWASDLQVLLEKLWHLDPEKRGSVFAHRWRYARSRPDRDVPKDLPAGIHLCGDSLGESRLESVWLSGREAARGILG